MHRIVPLVILAGVFIAPSAEAGGDIPFSFTALNTNVDGSIPDDGLINVSLLMDVPDVVNISSLELEINGLHHMSPMDLDIYLIDPFGRRIEIMTDLGGQDAIDVNAPVDLIFNDNAASLPPMPLVSGTYLSEGLASTDDAGFATYIGGDGGAPAVWNLIVIDDAQGGIGGFDSFTLRGTFVPEPVTLSLLAFGALAVVRRRSSRRSAPR